MVTMEDLFLLIGQLYVERKVLEMQLAEAKKEKEGDEETEE